MSKLVKVWWTCVVGWWCCSLIALRTKAFMNENTKSRRSNSFLLAYLLIHYYPRAQSVQPKRLLSKSRRGWFRFRHLSVCPSGGGWKPWVEASSHLLLQRFTRWVWEGISLTSFECQDWCFALIQKWKGGICLGHLFSFESPYVYERKTMEIMTDSGESALPLCKLIL